MAHYNTASASNDPVSYYNVYKYSSLSQINKMGQIHGVKRVIIFCLLTAVLPATLIMIPLYLRRNVFADVTYPVAESDVLALSEGISSVFCERLTLRMLNATPFNAFQLVGEPVLSGQRKHIHLRKHMTLPDDTLEYWGFYLLRGAEVRLRVCARNPGSRILVVRGEKILRTCGLLQHNQNKVSATRMDEEHQRMNATIESAMEAENNAAEAIDNDDEATVTNSINRSRTGRSIAEYDAHIAHGGNAITTTTPSSGREMGSATANNATQGSWRGQRPPTTVDDDPNSSDESISSFENDLLHCYDGQILLSKAFPWHAQCGNHSSGGAGAAAAGHHQQQLSTVHEVATDGYYYYIFYSDNDLVSNEIHANFDIFKPTYRFANTSKSDCTNRTVCEFPIGFGSRDTVVVEVPTRDGIEPGGDDDVTLLISTCQPRTAVYVVFPILVLFLILGCAFL